MDASGALVVTGGVLLSAAVVCAVIADERGSKHGHTHALAGWALFIAAAACFIFAAWWEVL